MPARTPRRQLVKAEWFKRYDESERPARFERIVQSWDRVRAPVADPHHIGLVDIDGVRLRSAARQVQQTQQIDVFVFDAPSGADAKIAELGGFVGGVPALRS